MVNLEGFLSFLGFDISLGFSWHIEIGVSLEHSVWYFEFSIGEERL